MKHKKKQAKISTSQKELIESIKDVKAELAKLRAVNAPRSTQLECFIRLTNLYACLNLEELEAA